MKKLPPESLPDWPGLMGAGLAAAYLDLSPGTLDGLGIPSRRLGRRVLYRRRDLDEFIDKLATEGHHPATDDERLGRLG